MRSNILNYAVQRNSVCVKGLDDYQTNQLWFVSWVS